MISHKITSRVLHVKVTREVKPGVKQVAHVHLALSVTSSDRVRGELVTGTGPHKSVTKYAVANWRDPVNPVPVISVPSGAGKAGRGKAE